MKYCKFCNCNKLKSEFSKDKIQKDKLKSKCKSCEKQYRQENKLKISKRMRLYNAQYRKENRNKRNADKSKRRSAKLQRTPPWLNQEHLKQIETIYQIALELTNKTGVQHHVDHIVPLLGKTVSGLHVPWNLQVLTASQNQSKSNHF